LIHGFGVRGTQHSTTAAGEVPHYAEARLEVPVVLLIDLVDVGPHAEKRGRARVEDHELVISLCRRDVPLVAQAEFEREPVANSDAILKEQADRALVTSFLNRGDVAQQLQSLGLSSKAAQDRVASLTDQEVQQLAGKIQSLPAGASDGADIAVAILIIAAIAVVVWYLWKRM